MMVTAPSEARKRGGDCLATVCPLCQFNLDAYYAQVMSQYGKVRVPRVYFTQLMGLAFRLPEQELGLRRAAVPFEWRPAEVPDPQQQAPRTMPRAGANGTMTQFSAS
jgi:heterodisulfide reductase subunit B